MKKLTALLLALVMTLALASCAPTTGGSTSTPPATGSVAPTTPATDPAPASALKVGVFYYQFADVYISSVRASMDEQLKLLGVDYQNFDGGNNQANQTDQINTAITDGYNFLIINIVDTNAADAAQNAVDAAKAKDIPVIFFNREVSNDVVSSYDKCAFVGTDAPEAGHLQGKMIGDYVLANFDALDLNKDGKISYVMFKGQDGNAEAEARTEFGVKDADAVLTAAGKPALEYYAADAKDKYLVDQTGSWSSQAALDYMNTILAEYSEANNNMVELVIANNDGMAEGAVSGLQAAGYNMGGEGAKTIPVFGVDATDSAKLLIDEGKMTGTIKQDAVGMAATICTLVESVNTGAGLMDNVGDFNVDSGVAKIRVPYGIYDANNKG